MPPKQKRKETPAAKNKKARADDESKLSYGGELISEMQHRTLQKHLKAMGLSATGKKEVLMQRLQSAMECDVAQPVAGTEKLKQGQPSAAVELSISKLSCAVPPNLCKSLPNLDLLCFSLVEEDDNVIKPVIVSAADGTVLHEVRVASDELLLLEPERSYIEVDCSGSYVAFVNQSKEEGEAQFSLFKLGMAGGEYVLTELFCLEEPFHADTKSYNSWIVNFVGDKYCCVMDKSNRCIDDMNFKFISLADDCASFVGGVSDVCSAFAGQYPTATDDSEMQDLLYLGCSEDGAQFAVLDSGDEEQIVSIHDTQSKALVRKCTVSGLMSCLPVDSHCKVNMSSLTGSEVATEWSGCKISQDLNHFCCWLVTDGEICFQNIELFPVNFPSNGSEHTVTVDPADYDDETKTLIIRDFPVAGCRLSPDGHVLVVWDANLHLRLYSAASRKLLREVALDEEAWGYASACCSYWPIWESVQRATTDQFGEVTPLDELCSLGTNDDFAALFSDREVLLITGNAVTARISL